MTLETMVSVPTTDSLSREPSASTTSVSSPLTTSSEIPLSIQPVNTPGAGSTEGLEPNSDSVSNFTNADIHFAAESSAKVVLLIWACLWSIWRRIRN
ncbi:hypothetical protein F4782DRAFT_488889 [Xylaria castorea]|nr:hypothetical protein F4782DRAFT_488889 [Xylaria castorea]